MTVYIDPAVIGANVRLASSGEDTNPYDVNYYLRGPIMALKDLLDGTEEHGADFNFQPGAGFDFKITLGDAAGADKLSILDSTLAEVFAIDSDGNLTLTGALDLDGQELILDADADTSITADTDDEIDVKIAGADDFKFAANTFNALVGSEISVWGVGAPGDVDFERLCIWRNVDDWVIKPIEGGTGVGRNFYFESTRDFILKAGANQSVYIDAGGSVVYRDRDAADATRMWLETATGKLNIDHIKENTANAGVILENPVVHGSAAAPTAVVGKVYYDTDDDHLYLCTAL